jgi:carbamoyltransferase
VNKPTIPCIIESHNTTWHDGGTAVLIPTGKIYALASERVGERYKHSWDSTESYEYLKSRLVKYKDCFNSKTDFFTTIDKENTESLFAPRHHLYHAAGTFMGSGFKDAAILVVDGQGPEGNQWVATTLWKGGQGKIDMLENFYPETEPFVPSSIGHFYTAIGSLAGMQNLHEEGKTMGLAPYGKHSHFVEYFRQYAYTKKDGSFYIDPMFVCAIFGNTFGPRFYQWGIQPPHIQKTWNEILSLRSIPMRKRDDNVSQDDMDIAYAGQLILDDIILGLVHRIKELTGSKNLCMAGGVALNCTSNMKILQSGIFRNVYIFPASDDSGQAIGKLFYNILFNNIPVQTKMSSPYLGPEYTDEEIRRSFMGESKLKVVSNTWEDTLANAASYLQVGNIIGWFQGRSEIGPRALGHRSILADPRKNEIRVRINSEIKFREWFRPLAPIIIEEETSNYFEIDRQSPFMMFATKVRSEKISLIPAVVHVDNSARIQTVRKNQEERLYSLLKEFQILTGIPILVNTSFNRKDEPIVETPKDAIKSFLLMNLDALVIDKYLLVKSI